MLLGADNGGPGVAAPTPGAPPSPTPIPATPLAPPPLPEGARDPALADRVSLSPRASQALQAQGAGLVVGTLDAQHLQQVRAQLPALTHRVLK